MTEDEMKNRISMALKDPILQQGFEIICRENAELKAKAEAKHSCLNCVAFGAHCPHKVNGDPYFYDCYLTAVELEKENEELKEINEGYCRSRDRLISMGFPTFKDCKEYAEHLTKAREIILKLYNAGRDTLMCRSEEKVYDNLSEAINDRSIEQFLKKVSE